MSPLHDFNCVSCACEFEELCRTTDEEVVCPRCGSEAQLQPVSKLADYTGQASRTVQYVNRNAPKNLQDSHISKLTTDTSFLAKKIGHQKVG